MKKLKLLILFYLSILYLPLMAQVSTGQEQEFDYGIKNNSSQTITSPDFLVTQGADGTQGKIPGTFLDIKTDNSAGAIQGFTLTNNGNGTVNISSGTAYLKTTNDPYASLIKYTIPGVTNLALTDNANNFILVDYNGGIPALTVTTNSATINTETNSIALVVSRVGNTLDWLSLVGQNVDANAKLRVRFLNQEGIRRANGAMLGFSNRNLTVTAGILFSGLIRINSPAFNTGTVDTFTQVYNNGSVWTRTTGLTEVNNTQYNNSGTLTNLPTGDFRTDFIYVLPNNPSKLYLVLGNTSYPNIGAARGATAPSILPSELQSLGLLVGRSIIQRLGASISEVASAFDVVFTTTPISDHNSLSGIQGGAANDYQHLTTTQLSDIAYKSGTTFTGAVNVPNPTLATHAVTKSYADGLVVGLLDDRGSYDASTNLFPATGGSGSGGTIMKGDIWYVSVAGTLAGKTVNIGDSFRALTDSPGQTVVNWSLLSSNLSYVPANDANVIHKTGNESFGGVKSSVNTGSSQVNGLSLTNNSTAGPVLSIGNSSTGNGITLSNTGNGDGISINNVSGSGRGLVVTNQSSPGRGIEVTNTASDIGVRVNNNFSGFGQTFENNSSGTALRLNSATTSTGDLLTFTKNLSAPITKVDQNGIMTTPTPTAGDNTTRVATTAFITNALSNYVTTNTTQNITAQKNMSIINIVRSNADFNGITLSGQRSSAQAGLIDITNSNAGFGYRYDGTGNGVGFSGSNVTGPVFSATGLATSSGHMFTAHSSAGSTSLLYHGSNPSGTVFQVNNLGSISGNSFIKIGGTASQCLMADGSTLTNPVTGTGAVGQVGFWTDAKTQSGDNGLFWDNTNKRLGIGTASPLFKTHLLTGNNDGLKIESSNSGFIEISKTSGSRWRLQNDFNAANTLELLYGNNVTPAASFLAISNNGNIGIGTVSPSSKLEVNSGDIKVSQTIPTPSTTGFGITFRNFFNSNNYDAQIVTRTNAGGAATSGLLFRTGYFNGSVPTQADRMYIDAESGNICINTVTDNGVDKLQVNGTISATGIKAVQGSGVGGDNPDTFFTNTPPGSRRIDFSFSPSGMLSEWHSIESNRLNTGTEYGNQMSIGMASGRVFTRFINGGAWSAWVEK